MSLVADIVHLLDSAVDAAKKVASDIEEIRKMLEAHPEIDSRATESIEKAVKQALGESDG